MKKLAQTAGVLALGFTVLAGCEGKDKTQQAAPAVSVQPNDARRPAPDTSSKPPVHKKPLLERADDDFPKDRLVRHSGANEQGLVRKSTDGRLLIPDGPDGTVDFSPTFPRGDWRFSKDGCPDFDDPCGRSVEILRDPLPGDEDRIDDDIVVDFCRKQFCKNAIYYLGKEELAYLGEECKPFSEATPKDKADINLARTMLEKRPPQVCKRPLLQS
jgi:hypothetical protein